MRFLIVGIEAFCMSFLLLNPVRTPMILIPSFRAGFILLTASPMHSISFGFVLVSAIALLYSFVLCCSKGSSGISLTL